MSLVGHLKDESSLSQYYLQIGLLNYCFRSTILELYIAKTKKLSGWEGGGGGGGRKTDSKTSLHRQSRSRMVKSFKYLRSLADQNLTFCDHVDFVYKESSTASFSLEKIEKL